MPRLLHRFDIQAMVGYARDYLLLDGPPEGLGKGAFTVDKCESLAPETPKSRRTPYLAVFRASMIDQLASIHDLTWSLQSLLVIADQMARLEVQRIPPPEFHWQEAPDGLHFLGATGAFPEGLLTVRHVTPITLLGCGSP